MTNSSSDIDNHFITHGLLDNTGFSVDNRVLFPLYFSETPILENLLQNTSVNPEVARNIVNRTGLIFREGEEQFNKNASPVCYASSPEIREEYNIPIPPSTFSMIDILDYIYGVSHSSAYGEKYREFLKMDHQRIPYPKNGIQFWELVIIGREIRLVHFLKSVVLKNIDSTYQGLGNNSVTRKLTTDNPGFVRIDKENILGRIYINDRQYFDSVPLKGWEFCIGGRQVAQQWLGDRHGSTLSPQDILYYQKMIAALNETAKLIKKVDEIATIV